eukprot:COSAG01_NODE_4781_length_4745_cov_131.393287_3_plen_184_part_00
MISLPLISLPRWGACRWCCCCTCLLLLILSPPPPPKVAAAGTPSTPATDSPSSTAPWIEARSDMVNEIVLISSDRISSMAACRLDSTRRRILLRRQCAIRCWRSSFLASTSRKHRRSAAAAAAATSLAACRSISYDTTAAITIFHCSRRCCSSRAWAARRCSSNFALRRACRDQHSSAAAAAS